jgi:phosphate transport system ATP-binding protein
MITLLERARCVPPTDATGPKRCPAMTSAVPTASCRTGPASGEIVLGDVSAWYGGFPAVADVRLTIPAHQVTAFIGPSGCGKTTLLRCLNRLHETAPEARVGGTIALDGVDLYGPRIDPAAVRARIGMVFQHPTPFPTMSIRDNVLAGVRLQGRRLPRSAADELVETTLRAANLWDEVRDRLGKSGADLSGGQQQRLCIARVLAVRPQVILMDEPCSALDPISTAAIEQLIGELRGRYTVVIVTHNMQQAARVSDMTGFFTVTGSGRPGRLAEFGPTPQIFEHPKQKCTADYVAGRFG